MRVFEKYNIVYTECNTTKEKLNISIRENFDLKADIKLKQNFIDNQEKEILALNSRVKLSESRIEELNIKYSDYKEKAKKIFELEKEILTVNTHNCDLQNTISKMSASVLSPNCISEMCMEVIDDLQQNAIENDALILKAKTLFTKNDTTFESWVNLSENEKQKLEQIVVLMENDTVSHRDIELLEDLELSINMKYLIVKNLIVLFYKYLEKYTENKSLNSNFKSKNNIKRMEKY